MVATPDGFQARRIVELARQLRPDIDIVVRTHSERSSWEELEADQGRPRGQRRTRTLNGMLQDALRTLGVPAERARAAAGRAAPVNPEGT